MMKAPGDKLLVQPTGDNSETERGRLIVVENDSPERKTWRGVVEHAGPLVPDIERGNVVHYDSCYTVHDKHVVPYQHVILYEDDE